MEPLQIRRGREITHLCPGWLLWRRDHRAVVFCRFEHQEMKGLAILLTTTVEAFKGPLNLQVSMGDRLIQI